ncbi:M23 family metallopeptidase [Ancylobacter defluvii]|uniref:Peptidase M23 n=1 Tax=Ancylobacter defluvii TaxID=1282440 RepID=A0A9W6JV49_9HYPH|nr:M23 family metallopeptidase [Ancylobacter defluvii]MBS7588868.1 M23 family metallopeptidase [Ancylobacter defluvii]GLK83732.1 peptidase M23 [Ancylobacter defluvii]
MSRAAAAILLALALQLTPAAAQSLREGETLSSITVAPLTPPHPVRGSDGRTHLAYELIVTNSSRLFVTVDKVEAVTPEGATLATLEGKRLAAMLQRFGGEGPTLAPGTTATLFMDVALPDGAPLPGQIATRVGATRQGADKDGKPIPMPVDTPFPARYDFTTAPVAVGRAAVVIEAPLRGKGWVAVNGCCDSITSHRGAVMAVNGLLRVPERFAIDFVKLDDDGRLFTGPEGTLASYPFYGTPIHAVAGGTVVNLYDETDEQVPGQPAKGITTANIGGNMMVVDIGGGNFVFYAHLQRGSLQRNGAPLKLGDEVKAGDVIGLLGNTGNSSAPHLHFHVMDGPSPLDADGLPYVFRRFTGMGVLPPEEDDALESGWALKIDASRLVGPQTDALPLNDQVVDFGE